jgi:hypothetical protein
MNKIIFAAVFTTLTFPVYAYPTIDDKASTLGFGIETAFLMTKSMGAHIEDARIGLNLFKYGLSKTPTSSGVAISYSGNLNLVSLETLADWHPLESTFRVSGLVYNNNNLTMMPSLGNVSMGGDPYTEEAGQSTKATIGFSKVVPNLGLVGGRTPKSSGLSFTNDIGIMFQGSPKTIATTNFAGVTAAEINKANSDLNSSLNNFKIYPFISIGVGYTF